MSTTALPAEMWLRIFGLVDDKPSLAAACLVSHQLNAWATEALVVDVVWPSVALALDSLTLWRDRPSEAGRVKTVSLRAIEGNESVADLLRIFVRIASFTNLRHLKLMGPNFPGPVVFHALSVLQRLDEITLIGCDLRVLAANVLPGRLSGIFSQLPLARSLTIDGARTGLLGSFLSHLTSLTIRFPVSWIHPTPELELATALAFTRRLVHLELSLPLDDYLPIARHNNTVQILLPPNPPNLPALRVLSVPWRFVYNADSSILRQAPNIEHLRVSAPIPMLPGDGPEQRAAPPDVNLFVRNLEDTHPTLKSISLCVPDWDGELVRFISHAFSFCSTLEVLYETGAPHENFLFDLGVHHLPRMHLLREIYLKPTSTPQPTYLPYILSILFPGNNQA
ncbi:hypothetical protein MKEN_00222600 [Mycena kentingensis (nom. inval.)]|nr:hypothetical protein MKEN_00222600 [Mycena kentingensis (nom. inval.)]